MVFAETKSACSSVRLLEGIATTPCDHSQEKQSHKSALGTCCPSHWADIKQIANDIGSNNLHTPVQDVVKAPGSKIEIRQVDGVEMVGVEPVASKEQREEANDVGIGLEGFEQTEDL